MLPGDMYAIAQSSATDIADAWDLLFKACVIKQYPIDIAESIVEKYIYLGLTDLEALRKTYHEVMAYNA